jgi:hypothetical protein
VTVRDAEVSLEGTVDSRETLRRIEACAEDTAGVREVRSLLRVQGHCGPQREPKTAATDGSTAGPRA